MQCCAIIPARGGSKGIPRKNLCLLAGKPLIAYSIEHARHARSVNRVIVSTDDPEIASVSKKYGAEVIWRPAEISGDTATSESALLHALNYLRDTEGYEPDLVVFLQATCCPTLKPDAVQNAIETLQREGADSLFSAYPKFTFVWRREGGKLSSFTYDYRNRSRRQDAPEDFVEIGAIFIFKPWVLRKLNNRLGGKITMYPISASEAFDVDEPDDLKLIEYMMTGRRSEPKSSDLSRVRLLVLDFDGVMTDNRVLVDQEGHEAVWCCRGDGWGIARVKEAGIEVVVLSTETNPVVAARCRKLSIECIQGCDDKLAMLKEISQQRSFEPDQIAYVGNDVNDLACMCWVGVPIAVADAVPETQAVSKLITTHPGGQGAVREVAEWLLSVKV